MSDQKTVEDFQKILAEDAELDRLKADTEKKKARVENKKYTQLAIEMEENEKDMVMAKTADLSAMSPAQILKIQQKNESYMESASGCMYFLCDVFKGIVPFFRKNLIFIGAESSGGKSTVAANIAFQTMKQTNPITGKKCKVLLITNEEQAEDFYNRVTCLNKGWEYSDHSSFTPEQKRTFDRAIPLLAKDGWLTVVDNNYNDGIDMTTSLEGLESIFENLMTNKIHYDVIIIDYYQNFIICKTDPKMDEYKIQDRVGKLLDHYKNHYPAPIILLSQLKPASETDPKSFKERIEGRKSIFNYSTIAIEIVAKRDELYTQWTVWKNRFNKGIGRALKTGFDRGMYVDYTNEFKEKVEHFKRFQENKALDKAIGIKDVFDKKKEKEKEPVDGDGNKNS